MRLVWALMLALASCGRINFDPLDGKVDDTAGVQRITAGSLFTCVIRSDHTTWCWGSSRHRELGADSLVNQRFPVRVDALVGRELVSIAAGAGAACAIDTTGTVWCWGDNDFGELGQGTTAPAPLPIAVTQLPRPARQIGFGSRHACAVLDDASLWCWGDTTSGQVGIDPELMTVAAPTRILTDVAQMVGGEYYSCALRLDGSVACWGTSIYGELGTTGTDHYDPQTIPGLTADALAAGAFHVCALVSGGHYRCWGGNSVGELGDTTVTDIVNPVPLPASLQSGFQMLAAATYFTCGIDATDSVRCFGDSRWGQLGTGDRQSQATPTLNGVVDAIGIAAGGGHACALHPDDSVECWGLGSSGELGDGHFAELTPQKVSLPGTVTAIGVGETHVCAVLGGTGDVYCWGNNDSLQLGFETGSPYEDATPTASGVTSANTVTSGRQHSCAVVGGTMTCWGRNFSGELGRGTFTFAELPGPVMGLLTAPSRISAGVDTTCAIVAGQLLCFGNDGYGQLGDGGGANQAMPQSYVAGTFTEVATGEYYTCAVDLTNQLSCWGYNGFGQVGNGMTNQNVTSPAPVIGSGSYSSVSTGTHTTCARTTTNTSRCWGLGTSGQIGDGGYTTTGTPSDNSLPMVVSVSTRGSTSCAHINAGYACWGLNTVGVFGDGTTISSPVPVGVPLANLLTIAVGVDFACGLTSSNELYCWGDNSYGQLGLGTFSRSLTPVTVQFP